MGRVEIIITSPYTRALHTAAIISRECNIPLAVEYDFHEWVPDLTYRFNSADSVQQMYDDFLACGGEYPEGETRVWETWTSIRTRVESVLCRYVQYEHVAVVCHGMVIQSLTPVDSLSYCGIVEFLYSEGQLGSTERVTKSPELLQPSDVARGTIRLQAK
jgi:broad specificity phosphatase PhoE